LETSSRFFTCSKWKFESEWKYEWETFSSSKGYSLFQLDSIELTTNVITANMLSILSKLGKMKIELNLRYFSTRSVVEIRPIFSGWEISKTIPAFQTCSPSNCLDRPRKFNLPSCLDALALWFFNLLIPACTYRVVFRCCS